MSISQNGHGSYVDVLENWTLEDYYVWSEYQKDRNRD
jgi:hypothetical protein